MFVTQTKFVSSQCHWDFRIFCWMTWWCRQGVNPWQISWWQIYVCGLAVVYIMKENPNQKSGPCPPRRSPKNVIECWRILPQANDNSETPLHCSAWTFFQYLIAWLPAIWSKRLLSIWFHYRLTISAPSVQLQAITTMTHNTQWK